MDFPRFLYIPWRMSQGALLYQDVTGNYGPLPNLVEAAAFRAFGPGLDVIVWLNITVTFFALFFLRGIFSALGGRLGGWLAGVVFLTVFAVPLYLDSPHSLFNFITPYSDQAVYGFAGCALAVFALVRHAGGGRKWWLLGAGAGAAIALLCKPELMLASLATLALYLALQFLQILRDKSITTTTPRRLGSFAILAGLALGGFFIVYLPVLFSLASAGGWAYAFRAANWVLQVFYDPAYSAASHTPFQISIMGFDHVGANLLTHFGWGALLLVGCAAAFWVARGWSPAADSQVGPLVFVCALCFAAILLVNWQFIGPALLVPTLLTALLACGFSFWRAWQGNVRAHVLQLAIVATAAILLLSRMLLNVRIYNYGFFLGIFAALLVVHLLVYELPRSFGRAAAPNALLQISFTLLVLAGAAQLGRASLANYANRTFPVGEGRDKFYASPPNVMADGAILDTAIAATHKYFSAIKSLVAFPESMAFNYHLKIPSPIPDLQFIPDVIKMAGEDNVLRALDAHPPEAVILYARDLSEYQMTYFGADAASGKNIIDWVNAHYTPIFIYGKTPMSATGHVLDILVRKDLAKNY